MITVLFVRQDSIYKDLGLDVYDLERDARSFHGSGPVVCHPPCRTWGRLRTFSTAPIAEHELGFLAVDHVRRCGGVLEHPSGSTLWKAAGLPKPGEVDIWGGWTLPIPQFWWGHLCEKNTWLYIVGIRPADLPNMPFRLGKSSHVLESRKSKSAGRRPTLPKSQRDITPLDFAIWLVELAGKCVPDSAGRGVKTGRGSEATHLRTAKNAKYDTTVHQTPSGRASKVERAGATQGHLGGDEGLVQLRLWDLPEGTKKGAGKVLAFANSPATETVKGRRSKNRA